MSLRSYQFVLAFSLCAAILLGAGCRRSDQANSTTKANSSDSQGASETRLVWARGELQPTQKTIRIAAAPGDRIDLILVKPGDLVSKGDPLVKLASEPIREQEIRIAKQRLLEAKAQLRAKQLEGDLQIELAESQLLQLKAQQKQAIEQNQLTKESDSQLGQARKQIDRMTKLSEDPRTGPMVGTIELEQKRIELSQSETKQKQAKLASEQLVGGASTAIEMARQKVDAAKKSRELVDAMVPITSLEMQIGLLEQQQQQFKVIAPSAGTILTIGCSQGEAVTAMPLMEMADLSSMSCIAEIQETQIRRLKIGQKASIQSSALPRHLSGHIIRINQVVGPHQMRLPNPMAKTDFRAVPVWIEIDKDDIAEAAKLVQLQVDVQIDIAP